MRTRPSFLSGALLAVFGVSSLVVGCNGAEDRPEMRLSRSDVGSVRGSGAQGYGGPRPMVDAADLDSVTFSLVGLGIGLGDDPKGQLPIISYLLPKLADYAQILRCRHDADLGDLVQNDIGQPDPQQALRRFIANDYWGLARKNPFCTLVTESHSRPGQVSFVDRNAGSGSHRYLVRACAASDRIRGLASYESPKECSAWVGVSPALLNYTQRNAVLPASTVEDLRIVQDRADALGRKIHFLAQRMENEIKACNEKAEREKLKAASNPVGLEQVLGFGIDMGRDLIDYGSPAADVLREINPTEISTALKNLFAEPKDFSTTCTAAERARVEGDALRTELDLLIKQHRQLDVDGGEARDVDPETGTETEAGVEQ